MNGIYLAEKTKVVAGGAAVLLNTAGITGHYVSLKNYAHCTIILSLAPASGTDTAAITLSQATDVAGTGAKALAYANIYKNADVTLTDTLVKTAVTSNTFNTSNAAKAELFVIEVDADMLDAANNFDCLTVLVADPGSVSTPAAAIYILSGERYAQATPPTATVD